VPVHLDRIIYKVMSKEPANRYRTADQLGRILISYQKQGSDATANVPPSVAPDRPQQTSAPNPAQTIPAQRSTVQSPPQAQPVQRATPFGAAPQRGNTPMGPNPRQSPLTPTYTPHPAPNPAPAPIIIGGNSPSNIPPAVNRPAPNPGNPYQGMQTDNRANPYGQVSPRETGGTSGSGPAPDYNITPPPPAIDAVSVILAIIALIAVLGLFPLWLWVLNTWLGH
ncbi:MAG TPA: hypothetical protein VKQ72_07625, partial [Aggregatilineales bacterium]|nr:hypothetical protein [Aggregatilineales bacterium]